MPAPTVTDLHGQFGNIDIYLFDQLLRGRIGPGMRVLDSGCGGGRNLVYLLRRHDIDVYASDPDPAAVASVRALAAELRPHAAGGSHPAGARGAAVVRGRVDGRRDQQRRAALRS